MLHRALCTGCGEWVLCSKAEDHFRHWAHLEKQYGYALCDECPSKVKEDPIEYEGFNS